MKPYCNTNSQRGVVGVYLAIIVVIVTLGIVTSIVTVTLGQQRIIRNITQSAQAYYAAEAGAEDALLRLQNSMSFTSSYVFPVGTTASASTTISSAIGGVRTITVEGDENNRVRKTQIVYQIDSEEISFNFGAQVGDGGIEMNANSKIIGNVFSNGTIIGPIDPVDTATITESAVVARNGSKIDRNMIINKDAQVHTCKDSTIDGNLTYVSGGSTNCTVGGSTNTQPGEINPANFPLSSALITDWKNDAQAGGVSVGNMTISSDSTLGPLKIDGDLTIDNSAILTLNGTLWVTGNLDISNGATIQLDAGYGDLSGLVITDGWIHIKNNSIFQGSGQSASFLMLLSTLACTGSGGAGCGHHDGAIDLHNNATGAVFYAENGLIHLHNNVGVKELVAYKIELGNNAVLTYDTGLSSSLFSSGPGGRWAVSSWKEIQ